jgi:hypothetical protein
MNLFHYRTKENDEDGDPLDHGLVRAVDVAAAVAFLTDRFLTLWFAPQDADDAIRAVAVLLYPLDPSDTPGVVEMLGDRFELTLTLTAPTGECAYEACGHPVESSDADYPYCSLECQEKSAPEAIA